MKTTTTLASALYFLAGVFAFPPPHHGGYHDHGTEPAGHEFQAPSPYDSRSPCPGLNALANHGYLPRDGKDISYEDINQATMEALNYDDGVFLDAFHFVQVFQLSSTGSNDTFNLLDLAVHDTIEMDGSQTRNDIYFGDDVHFDPTVFDGVAANLGLYDESETKYVTVETAAKARAARVAEAMAVNPTFNASAMQQMGSPGTTGLYLLSVWEDDANAAPKSWVSAFLAEDRIAYKEGFVRQPKLKTADRLADMVQAVAAVRV